MIDEILKMMRRYQPVQLRQVFGAGKGGIEENELG